MDTREERLAKLEFKWKANRMKQTLLTSENEEEVERVSEALLEECKETIFKLRRLRLQMERANGVKTRRRIFHEHKNVNFEIESIEFEKVNEYATLNEMERLGLVPDNDTDNLVKKAVYR